MNGIDSNLRTLTRSLNDVEDRMAQTQAELASNTKELDTASTGVLLRMNSQISSYDGVIGKLDVLKSAVQSSKAGLEQIRNIVASLTDLAQEVVNNAALTTDDRGAMNTQFQSLLGQINTAVATSAFDGNTFLNSSTDGATQSIVMQVGPSSTQTFTAIKGAGSQFTLGLNATAANLMTITTVNNATTTLAALQASLSRLTSSSLNLEKLETSIDGFIKNNQIGLDLNKSYADSITKPDSAALQIQLNELNNQQSINYYVMSQLNNQASAILQLFR
jgi:hypothetical protein